MSFETGNNIHLSIFGQSHSKAIGAVIDGLPAGIGIDMERIKRFMARRAPGESGFSTARKESDIPIILSGIVNGRTCGSPLAVMIENRGFDSSEYEDLRSTPRPMHADYPAWVKYKGFNDSAGGGHFSGRLTAPLCFAGAVCIQLLERASVSIGAHIASIGDIKDDLFDPADVDEELLKDLSRKSFPVINDEAGEKMKDRIRLMKERSDSVGGVAECCILGVPAGIGGTMFGGLESSFAKILFAIPAVKGVEFGAGFGASGMIGSEHNDSYYYDESGKVKTRTNNHGGILGGLSTGMPILMKAAFKPVPSIGIVQESIDLSEKKNIEMKIRGRHDPSILPRALPCVEAAAAIALYDHMAAEIG